MEELKAGLIIGVARTAQIGSQLKPFVQVPTQAWEAARDSDEDHFWERGQLIVRVGGFTGYGDGETQRYFDIRFDPQSFSGRITVTGVTAIPPPKPPPPNPAISAEEYGIWLPPSVVLKRLEGHLSNDDARSEIHRRLVGGELLSVARSSTWFQENGQFEIKEYSRLGSFLWLINVVPAADNLIWKSGTHTLTRPVWPDTDIRYNVDCFGIRFDPDGVAAILADCGIGDVAAPSRVQGASVRPLSRAPSVKAAWPPSDDEILKRADEMRSRGLSGYDIAKLMRLEPGFENVATRSVRDLIKGRYSRPGRAGLVRQ